jgi:hypothetical protein
MATMGQLQPGWSGICRFPLGDTRADNAVTVLNLRAKAGRLIISWRSRTTIMSGTDNANEEEGTDAGTDAGTETGNDAGVDAELGGVTKLVIPVELVRHFDGSYRFYFRCPGRETNNTSTNNAGTDNASTDNASTDAGADAGADASTDSAANGGDAEIDETDETDEIDEIDDTRRACGRRVLKLHFVRQSETGRYRFLCQRCGGLRYAGHFENRRQRALRRANKLWRRLDSATLDSAEGAAEAAQLIAGALQAETQATEAHTAKLQRLIAWLDHRRGPQFTL